MDNEPDYSVTTNERLLGYLAVVVTLFVVIGLAIIIVVKIQQNKQMADFIARRDARRAAAQTNVVNNPFQTTILDSDSNTPASSTAPQLGSFGLETNRN